MIRALLFVSLFALSAASQAHFLWAILNQTNGTIQVGLTEQPTDSPLPLGEHIPQIEAFGPDKNKTALGEKDNWLQAKTKESVIGVNLDYGVLDRTEQGRGIYWLQYYAKAANTYQDSEKLLGLPIEISVKVDGKYLTATVWHQGKPSAGAELVIVQPETKEETTKKTDEKGQVTLLVRPDDHLAFRALVTETTAGKHKGLEYQAIRKYCTLTIGTYQEKPFTTIISESFGDSHEVVGHTHFIETLMSGKLTKPQLAHHMQQRAIIHQEVDRILNEFSNVPFGSEQQAVTQLLKKDMAKANIPWPTEKDSWKLTSKLLAELRKSAEDGPYFALGVFHVYYGGITAGGRFIGAKIHETVGVDMTYYRLSDGYAAYKQKVNLISDPEARAEMIRGGKAAYKYIITSSNDPLFKPSK